MALRHIFFDLDRTIWDFDRNSRETLRELWHKHVPGLDGGAEKFIQVYEKVNQKLWESYRKGNLDKDTLRYKRFEKALEKLGVEKPDRALVQILGDDYLRHCPRKDNCLPGAHQVLGELQQKFELHIITNGFRETQHIKLEHSRLRGYFGQVITSECAGAKKPDPSIFRYALDLCEAQVQESVMIGDDWHADIEGARSLGMRSIYLSSVPKASVTGVDVVYRLEEVLQKL